MDWMLFSIWAVIAEEEGGLGLTALETGTISLLSFPIVTVLLISFFPLLRTGRRTMWMMWCSLTFFVGMVLVPMISVPVHMDTRTKMIIAVTINSLKDASYLIWNCQWTPLMG